MRWMYWCTSSWGASSFIDPWIQIESRCRCRIGPSSEKYTSGRVAGSVRAMARYTSKRASFGSAAQAFSRVARASAGAIIPRRAATAAPMRAARPARCAPVPAPGALGRRAVEPVRRDVRRIGLQHQRVQRQCRGQAAQLQRALEGHARRRNPAAGRRRNPGLLRLPANAWAMPVHGVGRRRQRAQPRQQAVGRAAHMQDHRQAMPARQAQLRAVEVLLARAHRRLAQAGTKKSSPISPTATSRGSSRQACSAHPALPDRHPRRAGRTAGGCPARNCRRRHAPRRTASKLATSDRGIDTVRARPCAQPRAPARQPDPHQTRVHPGGSGCRSSRTFRENPL
jgi:hypothetical protein